MGSLRTLHNGLRTHFWNIFNDHWDQIPLVFPEVLQEAFERSVAACAKTKYNPIIKSLRDVLLPLKKIQKVPAKVAAAPNLNFKILLGKPGPLYFSFYYLLRANNMHIEDFIKRYIEDEKNHTQLDEDMQQMNEDMQQLDEDMHEDTQQLDEDMQQMNEDMQRGDEDIQQLNEDTQKEDMQQINDEDSSQQIVVDLDTIEVIS